MPLIRNDERAVVSAVAALTDCNPFLPERVALERQALGDAFVDAPIVWHAEGEAGPLNPNAPQVRDLVERLGTELRGRLAAVASATSRDYFQNVTNSTNPGRDATLVGSLRTAIATLTTQYGTSDMTKWFTPKIIVNFSAESAASASMERENRGTFNEIIELSPTPTGQIIVPTGNSGYISPANVESPHLRDQLPLYETFQYRQLPFAPSDLETPTTTETLTLP